MRSMTGFGSGEGSAAGVTVMVELRSVNHRFLDIGVKLPTALAHFENEIRTVLKEKLARGRISCSAQIDLPESAAPVVLDENRLDMGIALLREASVRLEKETGGRTEITLDHLLLVPELFRTEEASPDEEALRAAWSSALSGALAQLLQMKEREGQELVAEMQGHLATLSGHLGEVERLAPEAVEEAHRRLADRLTQLIGEQVEPQRLAQEVAILADRCNITEECERLASHIEQFNAALVVGGQVAKRLNFLLQEMHREINTMGSKTSSLAITQAVVAMKDEVESMREQIQNLE